ncbi:DUF1642 domain-containing protein [Lactococcus lactis]|uniref:DUF1642 domain-containing protein n=1 Tax=Lactococcus lactis TaxID=1358 RepID=UPI002891B7B6|nr:DUF1642 domain-containing protein [Lactococcus lactis]MDT2909122.1 DUF1642 domain-containing protein [Lactococcus lactis]MDT2925047.1 DUF1642 domain-containing protein [Lactococcus lactis]MDT2951886.1 DUF1642 domain-containing protein [Lactococcus lactis]
MTKFEEEAIKEAEKSKVITKYYDGESTASDIGLNIKLGRATLNFPWLEFAKNWHSDEEFKELLDKYNNLNNLKLQQQALPVVPEDVDKAIKYLKTQNNFATFADLKDILTEKGLKWLNDFQFKDRRFGFGGLNNKLFILSYLAVTGYRVENQQLLYLKHIDMSKRNSINDLYLKKYTHADLTETGEHRLSHTMSAKGIYPPKEYCAFTQQEIDSMQTGSYEQIEVTE